MIEHMTDSQDQSKAAEQPEILKTIYERARESKATIALPDVMDKGVQDYRIAEAVEQITKEGVATPLLIAPEYFSALSDADKQKLIVATIAAREERGKSITEDQAREWLENDTKYVAAAMVRAGMVDGFVAGNISTTENTLRPALQIIGTSESYASSFFIMVFPDGRTVFFADCGFNYEPDSDQLAKIALDTAKNAQNLGVDPRIAFISFSTAGSASHASVEKVQKAIAIARQSAPSLNISEHEMQLDAALNSTVGAKKLPGSDIAGNANVLIFPDLTSGNSVYKMANIMGARAIGPIMQGLKAPANDLSRGCSAQDIVDVVAVTAMQAGVRKNSQTA